MTKCEADDYLEIGESDRKIRRTEFFRKLFSRAIKDGEKFGLLAPGMANTAANRRVHVLDKKRSAGAEAQIFVATVRPD
jgi:hypothetical protein